MSNLQSLKDECAMLTRNIAIIDTSISEKQAELAKYTQETQELIDGLQANKTRYAAVLSVLNTEVASQESQNED